MRKLLIALLTLSLLGCTAETSDPAVNETSSLSSLDARTIVEAGNEVFKTTFEANDAEALASLYTVDGMIIPPDGPNATGHDAIAAYWGPVMEAFASATLTTEEVWPIGNDRILERSQIDILDSAGNKVVNAKAMVLYMLVDGTWKLHRDIWNYGE